MVIIWHSNIERERSRYNIADSGHSNLDVSHFLKGTIARVYGNTYRVDCKYERIICDLVRSKGEIEATREGF